MQCRPVCDGGLDIPHVKHASNAKTKNTAAIPDFWVPIATVIASQTSTTHMPSAMLINRRRLPTESIMYHCRRLTNLIQNTSKTGGSYCEERRDDIPHLKEASHEERPLLRHAQTVLEQGWSIVGDDVDACETPI